MGTAKGDDGTAPTPRASRPLRILVADDNGINQRLVRAILAPRGHTLVPASNGREAVEAFERQPFDVVLMDLEMREMDGLAATAAIRAREALTGSHTPILATTASALEGERERCLAAGMDGFLPKPLRYEELIETVEGLAGSEGVAGEERDPVLDRGRLNAALAGLVGRFAADAQRLAGEMAAAIARGDGGELARAAHTLCGTASCFKADRLLELARRLEQLGREGAFAAETDATFAELGAELARLAASLDR